MAEAAATRPEAPANDNATALQPAEPHDLTRTIVRDAAARYAALRISPRPSSCRPDCTSTTPCRYLALAL
ncbi:MAG: hypothetical protein EXQ99_05485 [Alphaproteobacteria bacterium]|nr:hypothetical protein [Alphaproteobacteria bacterium]